MIQYGPELYRDAEVKDVSNLVINKDEACVTWVDVCGLGDADVIATIGKAFDLHPLALEDVVNTHQRPKLEMYGDSLFFVASAMPKHGPDQEDLSFDSHQIAMFLGRTFVVTFREPETNGIEGIRKRLKASRGRIRQANADYLLYALIDATVDSYFPVLEEHGERLDALDESISENPQEEVIRQIHDLRSQLLTIRRSVWPLREAINSLIRDSDDLVSDETDLYLRDSYDHTVQIIDVIETDRELCSDLRDFYLTTISNRMNQVMKFLTIIATLFIPLTFVTGLYGMNFNTQASDLNMPELNWPLGYPMVLLVLASTSIGLLLFFRKKGWLSN
ncbi:magnesium/cobalt transporter CorA [Crateriforma conspicua]|uniref:Magnesium transport protein CorA n=1 Tax=Crateriforma conspicua TaxID=2527996 RepID=A0A5C5Y746_9PLAN|nr:magnesium/cobalt transporter CorA [Crateriforma conspicua]TWT71486.1 Magnesium transport protein CorA [Crateriforma conspicua]